MQGTCSRNMDIPLLSTEFKHENHREALDKVKDEGVIDTLRVLVHIVLTRTLGAPDHILYSHSPTTFF